MQILFVDESGTPPSSDRINNEPFFVLGGVIIPEEIWRKVKNDLDRLKNKYEIKGEIKWRYFSPHMREARPHSLSHLSPEEKEEARSQIFSILSKYESIRAICIITDVAKAYKLPHINTSDELYWYSYKQITERFQYYLQDISRISGSKINGIIVCDHRAPQDDKRLQELHSRLLSSHAPATSRYSHLIEGVFVAPSRYPAC